MYDPALPADHTKAGAAQMRGQFAGLKTLIDAGPGITAVQVDAVNTVAPGQPARVDATVAGSTLHLTFSIPQGNEGAQGLPGNNGMDGQTGPQGDITFQQLNTAIADALAAAAANSSAKSNTVATLDAPFANDPPTVGDMEVLRGKMNELIAALRR